MAFFDGLSVNGSRFDFVGNQTWKNLIGYTNRVGQPGFYRSWTAADNEQIDFSGQADRDVLLQSPLLVGVSLNNGNDAETRATNGAQGIFCATMKVSCL